MDLRTLFLVAAFLLFVIAAVMTATGTSSGRLNLVAFGGILVSLALLIGR